MTTYIVKHRLTSKFPFIERYVAEKYLRFDLEADLFLKEHNYTMDKITFVGDKLTIRATYNRGKNGKQKSK